VFSVSASQDGRWLAVGSFQNTGFSVWDLRTRQEIARPNTSSSSRLAFSPKESLLAFSTDAQESSAVHLWNAQTQSPGGTLPLDGPCLGLTFSEDGRRLATFTSRPSETITLWSIPDGRKLSTFPISDQAPVLGQTRFSTSSDMHLAAYAMSGGRIQVLDLTTGKTRWIAKAAKEWTIALTFSPDGKILASSEGYAEGTIKLWDTATGLEIDRLEGHQGWVASLLFWPDGKKLASASADQTIRLWDTEDPAKARPLGVLRGHNAEVWGLALLPDHATLVSSGKDGSVRLWDTTRIQRSQTVLTLATNLLHWHFAQDGKSLIGLDTEGRVTRWRGTRFQECQPLGAIELSYPFTQDFVVLARDGMRVVTGSTNGIVRVWDLEHGGPARDLSTHSRVVQPMAFLPRSGAIVFRDQNNLVSELSLSTGRETQVWQAAGKVNAWAASDDEHLLAVFSIDGSGILRNRSANSQINPGVNLEQASAVNFSTDGKQFAVVSWIGTGKVWSLDPLRELGTLRGFLQGLHSVAFSPQNDRLAAGSGGKEALKLYDTANYMELITLEAEGSNYHDTEFSPDGNFLGSVTGQGVLRLWHAPSPEEIEVAETGGEHRQDR
jgi:WD40 repeat protein